MRSACLGCIKPVSVNICFGKQLSIDLARQDVVVAGGSPASRSAEHILSPPVFMPMISQIPDLKLVKPYTYQDRKNAYLAAAAVSQYVH